LCINVSDLTSAQRAELMPLMTACYVNMAAGQLAVRDMHQVIDACKLAIAVPGAPRALLVKAHYRCGVAHHALDAIDDAVAQLKLAYELAPTPKSELIRKTLNQFKREKNAQIKRDKKTFTGVFDVAARADEGGIYADKAEKHNDKKEALGSGGTTNDVPWDDANPQSKAEFLKRFTRRHAEQNTLDAKSEDSVRKRFGKYSKAQFEQMQMKVQDDAAKKFGLDLNDPVVQRELERLQRQHLNGTVVFWCCCLLLFFFFFLSFFLR
jgi:hypothetical protein